MSIVAEYDVIIVGSGPAGMTAAIYAARANLRVLLLDKLAPGGQIVNTNEIQNYTGLGPINGAELAIQMFSHTQELNVEFDYRTVREIRVENNERIVVCEEEEKEYSAHAVILCTGTRPRMLNVENELNYAGNGISWCAICDGAACRGKDVVVIGGGNSAVEESIYLAEIAKSLTIVTMFDLTADPIACDKLRAMPNVTVYPYLNRDLLLCAAMFHDIGKTKELSLFPENDYTDDGQLLGHIVMGTMMVQEKIRGIENFPAKVGSELLHCILAHHGELEYGSPKKPALAEAVALSLADNADAKLETMKEIMAGATSGEWMGFNRLFDSNLRPTTKL